MQTGTQERKKLLILAALVVVAAGVALHNFFPSSLRLPGSHSVPHAGAAMTNVDPRLHLDALERLRDIRYAGDGRDLFKMGAAPEKASVTAAAATARARAQHQAAMPPPMPRPMGPPPPPPVPLKAFGYATQPGQPKKVFLVDGDEVYVAEQGGLVEKRYQVLNIQPTTVLVKDLQSQQTALLPLPPSLISPGGH
jgi:hypothetical protein